MTTQDPEHEIRITRVCLHPAAPGGRFAFEIVLTIGASFGKQQLCLQSERPTGGAIRMLNVAERLE